MCIINAMRAQYFGDTKNVSPLAISKCTTYMADSALLKVMFVLRNIEKVS